MQSSCWLTRSPKRRAGLRLLPALPAVSAVAGCHEAGVLDPQGPISASERLILINATGIMLVVVVPVVVMTLAFAWWYRASNTRAFHRPNWSYSGDIELVVWSIPAMVVILLAGVGWISAHLLDPAVPIAASAAPIRVQVVSMDWKWLFIYPAQRVASVNQLTIPAATPVQFELTSASVMSAFFVPQLGSQIYTMPGMTTHLQLLADHPGDFAGIASHFSGDGFSDMDFTVHAVSDADFATWLSRTRTEGAALDGEGYARLARSTATGQVSSYRTVAAGMFERIVAEAAPSVAAMPGMK